MGRHAGISVAGRHPEQSARIEGTGIEVFEVLKVYRAAGEDWEQLRESFDWLSENQLRAALAYSVAHPQEMNARLKAEEDAPDLLAELWRKNPSLAPRRP